MLLEEGEDASAIDAAASAGPAPAPQPAGTAAPTPSAAAPAPAASPNTPPAPPTAAPSPVPGGRILASPLARRLAQQNSLDLALISGSGPNGRVVKTDIERALADGSAKAGAAAPAPAASAVPAPTAAAPAGGGGGLVSSPKDQVVAQAGNIGFTEIPHSGMRKTIARRLTESKQNVPHFYLTEDCELDKQLKLRKEQNSKSDEKNSLNDINIKASALALKKVPTANASWSDEGILMWENIDISVAVAIPDGLITPIIKNADQKGLGTISAEMKDLAGRAKEGKLKPTEYQGGTFSVSNLGMFGIDQFNAIINPPQSCILAVGAGAQKPVVKDGALAVATVMSATLSVDHRVVDGALGAQVLQAFKGLVEDPISMML